MKISGEMWAVIILVAVLATYGYMKVRPVSTAGQI